MAVYRSVGIRSVNQRTKMSGVFRMNAKSDACEYQRHPKPGFLRIISYIFLMKGASRLTSRNHFPFRKPVTQNSKEKCQRIGDRDHETDLCKNQ